MMLPLVTGYRLVKLACIATNTGIASQSPLSQQIRQGLPLYLSLTASVSSSTAAAVSSSTDDATLFVDPLVVNGGPFASLLFKLRAGGDITTTATTATTATTTGAAAGIIALNLSREGYLIQEMATYGTLTALVMNAALRLWTSTMFKTEQNVAWSHVFTISTALCVISGAFTAILFQLLVIYSKSALGMINDEGYLAFQTATAIYRKWGFRCFLTELSTFVLSFLLSVYQKLWQQAKEHPYKDGKSISIWQRPGTYIMFGCVILVLVGGHHMKQVLNLATKHIFTQELHDKFA